MDVPSATNFGQFVRDLTIPLCLIDADIRALRVVPERFQRLQHLRLLFNLELLRDGPFVSYDVALDPGTMLSRVFRDFVEERLAGGPVVFPSKGTIAVAFGSANDDFAAKERRNLE